MEVLGLIDDRAIMVTDEVSVFKAECGLHSYQHRPEDVTANGPLHSFPRNLTRYLYLVREQFCFIKTTILHTLN